MSFEFIKKLPTPQEIREKYPLSEELAAKKQEMRRSARCLPENPINSW